MDLVIADPYVDGWESPGGYSSVMIWHLVCLLLYSWALLALINERLEVVILDLVNDRHHFVVSIRVHSYLAKGHFGVSLVLLLEFTAWIAVVIIITTVSVLEADDRRGVWAVNLHRWCASLCRNFTALHSWLELAVFLLGLEDLRLLDLAAKKMAIRALKLRRLLVEVLSKSIRPLWACHVGIIVIFTGFATELFTFFRIFDRKLKRLDNPIARHTKSHLLELPWRL